MIVFLMMSAKLTTPGFLKNMVFWNKGYDIPVSVCDVINKILSFDLNFIVDMVMQEKVRDSDISMR